MMEDTRTVEAKGNKKSKQQQQQQQQQRVNRKRSKSPLICRCVSMVLLLPLLLLSSLVVNSVEATATINVKHHNSIDIHAHRVLPAAQLELYTTTNTGVIGVLSPENINITTIVNKTEEESVVNKILQPAIQRFLQSLTNLPDFAEDYSKPTLNQKNNNVTIHPIKAIHINIESSDVRLYHGVPEDYEVNITSDTPVDIIIVHLKATTVFGILHALQTLGQLLEFGWCEKDANDDASKPRFMIRDLPIYISDRPAFPYRGLMIDTARHYLPLSLILDNLNAMAMNKLNILHWHISDTQSFPLASPSFPELAKKGAYHPKRIYTPNDVKRVIQEAYLRGIRVIPEIDMPGHTSAIAKSHPEVMSHCPNPSEPMNPTVPETYQFIETLYNDLNELFPDEDFIHIGGDEVSLSEQCWLKSPSIVEWMEEHGMGNNTVELYEYFETKLLDIVVNKVKKTPIVWQEVFNLNLTITPDTIIDVWKGYDKYTIQNATLQNYRVILSGCWYLDYLGMRWNDYYKCEIQNFTGSKEQHDLMIGGHASMWGEHVDASNFISRVWPRASAMAERLWTGDVSNGPSKNIADRIHKFRCHMVLQGFVAGPTGPGSCPKEVPYYYISGGW